MAMGIEKLNAIAMMGRLKLGEMTSGEDLHVWNSTSGMICVLVML